MKVTALLIGLILLSLPGIACSKSHSEVAAQELPAAAPPVEIQLKVSTPFQFVAYGDSRFHDPNDTDAANPRVRQELVAEIAKVNPAFISFGGDIVYNGYDTKDWEVWDKETAVWREHNIPVYPALGNHDLHGDEKVALANYFKRFPDIQNNRYYSVRAGNSILLVLDSALDETSGPQGKWLEQKLENIPEGAGFVFLILHHPPYTSSSDAKKFGGGHSSRSPEHALAKLLESRQANLRARIIVFSGHVHNYEHHFHGGVHYFVTGGAGAHAYPIERAPDDLFQSKEINYHYLLVSVGADSAKVEMNRLEIVNDKPVWTKPDQVTIAIPAAASASAH
jgi:Icc-related predicted phosphoesterase